MSTSRSSAVPLKSSHKGHLPPALPLGTFLSVGRRVHVVTDQGIHRLPRHVARALTLREEKKSFSLLGPKSLLREVLGFLLFVMVFGILLICLSGCHPIPQGPDAQHSADLVDLVIGFGVACAIFLAALLVQSFVPPSNEVWA